MMGSVYLSQLLNQELILPRCCMEGEKNKAYNTCGSQAVTHPSTEQAQHCLTSVIGREPVYSAWYGRTQE